VCLLSGSPQGLRSDFTGVRTLWLSTSRIRRSSTNGWLILKWSRRRRSDEVLTGDPHVVDASTVRRLVAQLEQAGIPVWIDGGWGIDVLLGRETRPHRDLDVIIRVSDVPKALELLRPADFVVREGSIPHAFVLASPSGDEIDFHTVTVRSDGTAVHRMDDGNDWVFPADAFTGVGTIDGASVQCLSAETQVRCHAQGYVPTEKDFRDMELLQEAFGVDLPPSLRRARPARTQSQAG